MKAFAFNDLMDSGKPVRVHAEISFVATEDGGRKHPVSPEYSYRPNHNFGDSDNRSFYVGQVEAPPGQYLHPGKTYQLPITFLSGPGLQEALCVGREWRIQEGPHLVATAKVLSIEDHA